METHHTLRRINDLGALLAAILSRDSDARLSDVPWASDHASADQPLNLRLGRPDVMDEPASRSA
jgi:hypothetical protein